ncbi:MAG: DUF3090 family protein, partial [Planctomycetes bacterium]|nr:DUF3090 family protein [Planctomycetota bacterium]
RIEKEAKGKKAEPIALETVDEALKELNEGKPLSATKIDLTPIRELGLLTAKPILYVFNVDEGILTDLPAIHPGQFIAPLSAVNPEEMQWIVGGLAVAYEEDDDRLMIVAEEMPDIDDEDDFNEDFDFDPATARIRITRAQVAAFIAVGNDIVRAGRPACRLCGRPLDPGGHPCPRLN